MPYIEKLVMKGFKSFASETELPLENGMNVVVGPNGSGKSNITDAICFVLGRLSIKSMRATKSSNLIFSGTKLHKGAPEASVKIVFNNEDKNFTIDKKQVDSTHTEISGSTKEKTWVQTTSLPSDDRQIPSSSQEQALGIGDGFSTTPEFSHILSSNTKLLGDKQSRGVEENP